MKRRKFYEEESPEVAYTGRNVLEYFPKAGKLCISKPDWVGDDGITRRGRTVTLDLCVLSKDARLLLGKAIFSK